MWLGIEMAHKIHYMKSVIFYVELAGAQGDAVDVVKVGDVDFTIENHDEKGRV